MLLILSRETHNDVKSLFELPFHIVLTLYNMLIDKLNEEKEMREKEENKILKQYDLNSLNRGVGDPNSLMTSPLIPGLNNLNYETLKNFTNSQISQFASNFNFKK